MAKATTNQSAFKQLYSEMFNQGCDFSKVSKDLKKPIKCYVKESFPHFLVTDGYFFVPLYFTKEAISEFKAKFHNVSIVDLQERVIIINEWTLEMHKVNSSNVFTSYANLEARLVVQSFKPNLTEKLNPTRYPINLYRDNEMKTTIQAFRHGAIQKSLNKSSKDTLPDISKISGDGKKQKVEEKSVVALKGDKGGDFSDFSFKEGNTATIKMSDIYIQEKGKDAYKKQVESGSDVAAAPKVKGGAKGKKKAESKSKGKAAAKSGEVGKRVDKILKYTPSKSKGKKEGTPQKGGKISTKRPASKRTPAMPSPGGKKSPKTTDQMTMNQFKQYLEWHEKKKRTAGKSSSSGKVLGKRSTGKASSSTGKKSAPKTKKATK